MNKIVKKRIFVKSYGCQMNVYDSNRIKNLFEPKGYSETDDLKKADLIVLNTCHIREKATEKIYSDIGRIKKIKKNKSKLVIAGCVAQAEGQEIKKRASSVDYIVGPQSYHKLPLMIENNSTRRVEMIDQKIFNTKDWVDVDPPRGGGIQKVDFQVASATAFQNSINIKGFEKIAFWDAQI